MESQIELLELDEKSEELTNQPWKPILGYVVFGFLWILLSDNILNIFVKDIKLYEQIQTIKGWLYVCITAFGLYLFIKMDNEKIFSLNTRLKSRNEELMSYSEELLAIDADLHHKIDELNTMTDELANLATKDHLTKINNRRKFEMDLGEMIEKKVEYTVILLGIDCFRDLNNFHGHIYGDTLLKHVAQKLKNEMKCEEIYRSSGSEFALVIKSKDPQIINGILRELRTVFTKIINVSGLAYRPTACYGVVHSENDDSIERVYKKLNMTLSYAKSKGKNRVEFFNASFANKQLEEIQMDSDIDTALSENEFELYLQPIYELHAGEVKGYEMLLRWPNMNQHNGNIGNVIGRAEKTGQILDVDKWVVSETISMIEKHPEILSEKLVSVNISTQSFHSEQFFNHLIASLKGSNVQAKMIEIEVTEHSILQDLDMSKWMMEEYKQYGFNMALDDFGTKYSSLNYLSKLPFDTLKIDKSYIDDICTNTKDHIIVKHIVDLSRDLGLTTIAEGIECAEQELLLKQMGCSAGQGYLKAKPMSMNDLNI